MLKENIVTDSWRIIRPLSPALTWSTLPPEAIDLILVMEDLNSPRTNPRIHVIAEFPPAPGGLLEGAHCLATARTCTGSTSTHSTLTSTSPQSLMRSISPLQ